MIIGVEEYSNETTQDSRGSFSRIFDANSSKKLLSLKFVQSSISRNQEIGTLRGLHFQRSPSKEWKYVSCIEGRIFDVLVDARRESDTYGKIFTSELSVYKNNSLLIPPGVAHGFITLEKFSTIHYQMTDFYQPSLSVCLNWNDTKLDISWPMEPIIISPNDSRGISWPVAY